MKLLIVEDELRLLNEISEYLTANGFSVISSTSVDEAQKAVLESPELILLDWRLPDGEGLDLLREWRQQGLETPVIMMTARAETVDKVVGLEIGANDYVTKPFEPRELLARIRAQLRTHAKLLRGTSKTHEGSILKSSGIRLDLKKRQAFYQRQLVGTSKLEFDLLRLFLEHPDEVLSRLEIMNSVWGRDNYQSTKTIEFHVAELRKKTNPECFETIRGIGYMFKSGNRESYQ